MGNEYDISIEDGVTPLLEEDEIRRDCVVSVSVVSDDRMHELNLRWRGVDRATDVLSLECERPDDPDLTPGEPCELGDIVLAPAYIARQSKDFGTTPADECRLLLVHGVLHLLGYDHMTDEEAAVMEAREDELVSMVKTDARLDHVEFTRHRGSDDR